MFFKKSKGEYIFFLDSDDFYNKYKLSTIIKEFNMKKNLQIIFDLPILKYSIKLDKQKFKQKKFIISNWPRFTPQSCISVKKEYSKKIFFKLNLKKFETLWFDFRIASYTHLKYGDIYIFKKISNLL